MPLGNCVTHDRAEYDRFSTACRSISLLEIRCRCLATLQDRFRRHGGKQMHCPSDDTRPAGLMVGTQPRSVLPGVCLGHELLCQMTNDVTR